MTLPTTTDTFYQGAVTLRQPEKGYRFGTDAMLLAACVTLLPGMRILELGCGVSAVLHALAWRARRDGVDVSLTGIELQPAMADLAQANAMQNRFDLTIVQGDVTDKALLSQLGTFHQVICNPPFHPVHSSSRAGNECRTTAHVETETGLQDWIQAANRFLKPKGQFTMIHRADRMGEYLPLCDKFLGAITLIPFWPKAGEPAKRLVLSGKKGDRGGLTLHPGVVLHGDTGGYSAVAHRLVNEGQCLTTEPQIILT